MQRSRLPVADRITDRLWFDTGFANSLVRLALRPLGAAYLGVARVRNRLFDSGALKTTKTRIPVMSIGNLTAGGTGKTPIAAWMANALRDRGASPAIVMRGYGRDEPLVHEVLSPGTTIITAKSRVAGVSRADIEFKCDVAVLDDGFQHRWIDRVVDIVLLGAEETRRPRHGLPAGPWREPLASLRRATLVIVTRKTAADADVSSVIEAVGRNAPRVPVAVVALTPRSLVRSSPKAQDETRIPMMDLSGENVLVIAAIGNARAFVEQVARFAGTVQDATYPDHHAFSASDIQRLVRRSGGVDRVVCTLKDLVKLRSLWPESASPLWYVSQEVIIERGADEINRQLGVLLSARPTAN